MDTCHCVCGKSFERENGFVLDEDGEAIVCSEDCEDLYWKRYNEELLGCDPYEEDRKPEGPGGGAFASEADFWRWKEGTNFCKW